MHQDVWTEFICKLQIAPNKVTSSYTFRLTLSSRAIELPTIINQVHSIDNREGMPSRIKLYNITGLVLYDSAWIIGVEYSEDDKDINEF